MNIDLSIKAKGIYNRINNEIAGIRGRFFSHTK